MAFIEEEDDWTKVLWPVPWHAHIPGALLLTGMSTAWLLCRPEGMAAWGISGAALAEGRYETIALHMAAHGPLVHLWMNMAVLVAISGPLVARLGRPPAAWGRYLALFVLGGLAGTALFLALHPQGRVPMLGASGAIYALFALKLRLPLEPGPLLSVRTPDMRREVKALIIENVWLFLLLTLAALLSDGQGGLAWEAHLGGFLFGLFAGPYFLPRSARADEGTVAAPEGAS
jgi:membrane associated rhomboid family serine protease